MKFPAFCLAALLLASCTAPISYTESRSRTPAGEFRAAPLDAALRELQAGRSAAEPLVASGHFIESARLAGEKAIAGEEGALALYNHATARLVETLARADALPWGSTLAIPHSRAQITLRGKLEPRAPAVDRTYRPVDNLRFRGKYSAIHTTRPGIGAPLVAKHPENPDYRLRLQPQQIYDALTAVLRYDSPNAVTLELHNPFDTERISIVGRNPKLAADFSAPVSLMLANTRVDKLGLARLLNPQKYSHTSRLVRLQKYDPERIPLLLVHGLQDTPATWAPLYHTIIDDPVIRKNYQIWVFSYPSGFPYPYSASLLRRELDAVTRSFPDHRGIVIVGHSMGGLVSRLMVTDAGEKIWRGVFGMGPDEMQITGASRQLLLDALIFKHRPEIDRAIFIAAPHRGSKFASNWIGRLASRLVRIPYHLSDVRDSLVAVITADNASRYLDRTPNSIDTLSPNNPFVRELNNIPVHPGIPFHSIMGDRGRGGNKDRTRPVNSDGIVPFWSSHLAGAASEKIVPANHRAHQHPEGIAEVRRILREHAGH